MKLYLYRIALLALPVFLIPSSIDAKDGSSEFNELSKIALDPTQHDTTRAKALTQMSDYKETLSFDSMYVLASMAMDIVNTALEAQPNTKVKLKLIETKTIAMNNFGYVFQMRGDYDKAIAYYDTVIATRKAWNIHTGTSNTYSNIGFCYEEKGDIPKALDYYQKGLKIDEENNNLPGVANLLNSIAYTHYHQGDDSLAIEYYKRSLALFEELEDISGVAYLKNNIGEIYLTWAEGASGNEKDSLANIALAYNLEAFELRKQLGDKHSIANSLNNLGSLYKIQGDYDKAYDYYQQCKAISLEIGLLQGVAFSQINMGKLDMKLGRYASAKKNIQQSLNIFNTMGYAMGIQRASKLMSELYEKEGNWRKAHEMTLLYYSMKDSLINEETQRAAAKQEAKYQYEKQKAIDDAQNEKRLAIEQQKQENQQKFTLLASLGLILTLLFLVIISNRLKITRRQKKVIEDQKLKVENQKHIIEEAHREITDSIAYAKRIQSAILPPPHIVREYLEESFVIYLPKDIVAGDFFWMRSRENKILFAVADCTGHGVPGAMVSVVCNNALNRSVREYGLTDPGEILEKSREIVVSEFEKSKEGVNDGMDIALCTLEGNILRYAGAYNPLWLIRDGALIETKANRFSVGLTDTPLSFTTHTLELQEGDLIYIFTDGIIDQFGGPAGKKLKIQGFKEMLLHASQSPISVQKEELVLALESWQKEADQVDDICIIGFQFRG
jgi:serine phosphatase RsbU (regulator of sigma subunit)